MKKFFAGLVVGIVLASTGITWASNQVRLFVNGREVAFADAPPQILNNRVMVPARPLAEALGAKVEWDNATRSVIVSTESTADTTADSSAPFVGSISIDGKTIPASLSKSEAGEVCVPLRTITEFASVTSPSDLPRDTFAIDVDGVRLTKELLWSYQERSFVCLPVMAQKLKWSVEWNPQSLTLSIRK